MNNLQLALKELDEEWFASLPEFEDKPPFEVSKEFLKWEQHVIYGKKSASSKVVKVILIAAALLILFSVVSLSTTKGREFVMHFFKESAVYNLEAEQSEDVYELKVEYLPEGFMLEDSTEGKTVTDYSFSNGTKWLDIQKRSIETTVDFDYNRNSYELIEHNDIIYTISFVDEDISNVIWNHNNYYYHVSGSIDKETALKIAYGVE